MEDARVQICSAASQHLTWVSCCCCCLALFNHNQLTVIIKRLCKQTLAWVSQCLGMGYTKSFLQSHLECSAVSLCASLNTDAGVNSLRWVLLCFSTINSDKTLPANRQGIRPSHQSFVLSFYLNALIKFNGGFPLDALIANTDSDSKIRV